jgi:hypothetical protein
MNESKGRTSELWKGARRGAGWAIGFGAVVGASNVARHGWRPTVRTAFKTLLGLRALGAETGEQLRDLYTEAESEYAAEAVGEAP